MAKGSAERPASRMSSPRSRGNAMLGQIELPALAVRLEHDLMHATNVAVEVIVARFDQERHPRALGRQRFNRHRPTVIRLGKVIPDELPAPLPIERT